MIYDNQNKKGGDVKKHYAWVIAWTGALVVLFAHGFGRMSYSVILPPMKKGLSLTYTQVGLIGTGNFIGYLCLAVIGGVSLLPVLEQGKSSLYHLW